MAALTIRGVEHGWAGDRKRNRVIAYCASTNADTVTPTQVGLRKIEAVVPTNRIGDVPLATGTKSTCAAVGLVSVAFGTITNTIVVTTSETNWEAYFFGE